jgi:hypothetical protein
MVDALMHAVWHLFAIKLLLLAWLKLSNYVEDEVRSEQLHSALD